MLIDILVGVLLLAVTVAFVRAALLERRGRPTAFEQPVARATSEPMDDFIVPDIAHHDHAHGHGHAADLPGAAGDFHGHDVSHDAGWTDVGGSDMGHSH